MIEIGIPFTDPMADGKTIQDAGQLALNSGFRMEDLFSLVKSFREKDDSTPIILMGYFNPIHKIGSLSFIKKIKSLGVDGLIIVDLPPEEDEELCVHCSESGIDFIRLLTPTSNNDRLKMLLKNTSGFLYYVSVMGVTGTKVPVKETVEKEINRIKQATKMPICVGFGIKTPEDAKNIALLADGAVVGSAIIDKINSSTSEKDVYAFISDLANSIHLN
jgi:tryptophan synthase alpha chain